jgi:hypothetical protein
MGSRILLVEGQDDLHVLSALFAAHQVPQTFTLVKTEGITPLLEAVPVRLKTSDLERLGVVLDADEDIQARWAQLRGQLLAAGCEDVPEQPTPGGTLLRVKDGPKVGAWLMPDNRVPGILEDFLAFLIPEQDRLLPRVRSFLESIPEEDRRCPPPRLPKAQIHAWLAVQEQPGKPLGQAITARYLDAHRGTVAPFLAWVRAVFLD